MAGAGWASLKAPAYREAPWENRLAWGVNLRGAICVESGARQKVPVKRPSDQPRPRATVDDQFLSERGTYWKGEGYPGGFYHANTIVD